MTMHVGAFGMSTVPEVFAGRAMGMEVRRAASLASALQ
jgi:hypothetical protein